MKKISILICLIVLVLTGCSNKESATGNVPNIEDHAWQMTTVQSVEADGQVIAHAPGTVGVPDTSVEVVLKCVAADGDLTLTDESNVSTYTGTYELTDTSQETRIYEIVVGDSEGMAVVSTTTYQDESRTPTLIISLDDYALNFFPLSE